MVIDEADQMIAIPTDGPSSTAKLNVVGSLNLLHQSAQILRSRRVTSPLPGKASTRPRLLVNQKYLQPLFGCGDRTGHACWSGTDDEQIAERIILRRRRTSAVGVDPSETGYFPHLVFIERKQPSRRVKRLVVEANGHETTEPFGDSQPVPFESTRSIDRTQIHAGLNQRGVATHVGALAVLNHDVGVVTGKAVNAARPVILEATSQQTNIVRPQRTAQHVAGKPVIFTALKPELHGPAAVDPFAITRRQSSIHRHAPRRRDTSEETRHDNCHAQQ